MQLALCQKYHGHVGSVFTMQLALCQKYHGHRWQRIQPKWLDQNGYYYYTTTTTTTTTNNNNTTTPCSVKNRE